MSNQELTPEQASLIAELESRSMSTWTTEELHQYATLTRQECCCDACDRALRDHSYALLKSLKALIPAAKEHLCGHEGMIDMRVVDAEQIITDLQELGVYVG